MSNNRSVNALDNDGEEMSYASSSLLDKYTEEINTSIYKELCYVSTRLT